MHVDLEDERILKAALQRPVESRAALAAKLRESLPANPRSDETLVQLVERVFPRGQDLSSVPNDLCEEIDFHLYGSPKTNP